MPPPFTQGAPPGFLRYPLSFSPKPQPPFGGFPPGFGGLPPAPSPASAGGLQGMISSLLSGGGQSGGGTNLIGMLMNAQKAIKTAQTVIPMIQQFGPLIKNAPAILSMLNSLKDADQSETDEEDADADGEETQAEDGFDLEEELEQSLDPDHEDASEKKEIPEQKKKKRLSWDSIGETETKPSRPKMYI